MNGVEPWAARVPRIGSAKPGPDRSRKVMRGSAKRRLQPSKRRLVSITMGAGAGILLGLLMGPAATWLQVRSSLPTPGAKIDAIYVLAGEREQDRRIKAVLAYWTQGGSGEGTPPELWVGNDPNPGPFCPEEGRNLPVSEWTLRKILLPTGHGVRSATIVPGHFAGTDGEMQALAAYLEERGSMTNLLLVTSPFHMRRARSRLLSHLSRKVTVYAWAGPSSWKDRLPWVVASEGLKLLRDAAGWSEAPWISRPGWLRCGSGGAEPIGSDTVEALAERPPVDRITNFPALPTTNATPAASETPLSSQDQPS